MGRRLALANLMRPSVMRTLGLVSTVGMFFVILTGSLVTNTGSADGCGTRWPFCDGDWTTMATFIEANHRVVTGILGIIILALSIAAWQAYSHRWEIRVYTAASLFFLLLQSFLGAAAVMWGSPPAVMATHFGVSLASFGSVLLLSVRLMELTAADREGGADPAGPPAQAEEMLKMRRLVYWAMAFSVVVVYLGAYARHTSSGLACSGWPLCNGQLFPGFQGAVGIVFMHRLSALLLTLFVAYVGHQTRAFRRTVPALFRGGVWTVLLLVAQSLSGWLVIATFASVAANVIHSAILTLYSAALFYMALKATPWEEAPGAVKAGAGPEGAPALTQQPR